MISLFESTIARVVTLAVFLPVVAGQGGIGGTQTLTLVARSMALGDIPGRRALRLIGRELVLGLLHGVLLGVVVALVVYAWRGDGVLGVVVGIAMLGNMLIAGLAGTAVPLILRGPEDQPGGRVGRSRHDGDRRGRLRPLPRRRRVPDPLSDVAWFGQLVSPAYSQKWERSI